MTLPKRSAHLGQRYKIAESFSADLSVRLFYLGARIRAFERCVQEACAANRIKIPVYLCLGQEFNAAALVCGQRDRPLISLFAQHRAHGHCLARGGSAEALRDELLGLPTGCAKGRSGSNAIHSPETGMFGHSGLMGEQVSIAVGAALASGKPTMTIFGDASAEEDYVYPSLGFAASRKLPVLFICEDNGLSILTPVRTRRNWSLSAVTSAMGIPSVDITDDPWLVAATVRENLDNLPFLLTIHTCRDVWHAGTGNDGPPEWNRFELVYEQMISLGLEAEANQKLIDAYTWAKETWKT